MLLSIQYLRGLAAILVLLYHASHKQVQISGNGHEWQFGSSGVDLFFVISGFIMCHVTAHKKIRPVDFIRARVKRIIPLYWTLSLAALAIYLIKPNLVNSSGGTTSIINSFTLIPNGEKYLIQNGWTLSYEFLFYTIFSLTLFKWCKLRIPLATFAILALVITGSVLSPENATLQFVTSKMLVEFLMGMIAFIYVNCSYRNALVDAMLLVTGATALYAASLIPHLAQRVVWYGVPHALLLTGLVSAERLMQRTSSWRAGRLMRLIGDASFSIYLTHPFVIAAIGIAIKRLHLQGFGVLSLVIMTTASIISGYLCFTLLETPLNHAVQRVFPGSTHRLNSFSVK